MWRVTRQNSLSGDADGVTDQGFFDQPLSGLIEGPLTLPGLATATTLFAGRPGTAGVGDQTQSLGGSVPVAALVSATMVRAEDSPRVSSPASMTNSALGGATIASHPAAQASTTPDQSISTAVGGQLAQQMYGVNGQGITIGIISNAFNSTKVNNGTSFQTAVAGGWVDPNAVYTAPQGLDDNTSDHVEGLSMAEIVHEIAPNAHIIFYTADTPGLNGSAGTAAAINALAADGCNIICDDQSDNFEAFYQPGGPADAAVTNAVANGITYFTCAINSGPSSFYESQFNSATVIQNAILPGNLIADAYNFGTATNPTPYELIDSTAASFGVSLQWEQPWQSISPAAGSQYTLQWHLYEDNNGNPGNEVASGTGDGKSDPVSATKSKVSSGNYLLSIVLADGALPTTGDQFKIIMDNNDSSPVTFETMTGQVDPKAGVGSGTTWGHNENPNAITVGAVPYSDTPAFGGTLANDGFSASGPGEYLFDTLGNPLTPPQMLGKVNLSAPDGGATSLTAPGKGFSGTSAATPAAAAVAALMLQINPALTPAQIAQILQNTAIPFGDPLVAGAGLVNALAAVAAAISPPPNAPPAGTTANMVLSNPGGVYNIYNIGGNSILASYQLAFVGTDWAFVTLGGFNDGDTSDMLLRNGSTGTFQVYDIVNNNITQSVSMGAVGLNWQVAGFGDFNQDGATDMILRDSGTGAFQIYNIMNNGIINSAALGPGGLDWQVGGFGNFSSLGESDMILRNETTGGLLLYDISNNQVTNTAFLGPVGLDWQIVGVGNFSSVRGETDMLMRNITTGAFELYNISNNQITATFSLGAVGLNWQVAGFGPLNGAGTSDMVLVSAGAYLVYDIANNQITGTASLGQVGPNWQFGGFAAAAPTGSAALAQLVQAMAAFPNLGASDISAPAPFGPDPSQQLILTAAGHG
jgi:Subtilase family